MSHQVVLHPTPAAFLDRAGAFLLAAEAERSLLLGLAEGLPPDSSGSTLVTVERDDAVEAVALCTAPRKLLISDGPPAAIDALQLAMRQHLPELPGVIGPAPAARRFADAWASGRATIEIAMRLHRLDVVNDLPRPSGHPRIATPADARHLAPWAQAFVTDSGSDDDRPGEELLHPYLASGALYLWEDPEPRCMVGWSRGTPQGASITLVYTPPAHRGRGYATALVADLSAEILARGKRFCVLFTNLANATANAIYARIGYRPLGDHDAWRFPPK